MSIARLCTFASTTEQIEIAISCGAERLILESPHFSIRSFHTIGTRSASDSDHNIPDQNKSRCKDLGELVNYARTLKPSIELIINCDFLFHERHTPRLTALLDALPRFQVNRVRVQDQGLLYFFKQHAPHISCEFAIEIGNQTVLGSQYYQDYAALQCLSMDIGYQDLRQFRKQLHTPLELQIQGPILIQYSNRRFLSGLFHPKQDLKTEEAPMHVTAEDCQYPKRSYTFYDNEHGHFMFLYFHRCLLNFIPELSQLKLDSWLIDARGESLDYLRSALCAYRDLAHMYHKAPTSWARNPSAIAELQKISQKPQKPGFFKVNRTDQIRRKQNPSSAQEWVATILDSIKHHWATIECEATITVGETLILRHPKGLEKQITIHAITDLSGKPIEQTTPDSLARIRWEKQFSPRCKLYRPSDKQNNT